MAKKFQIFVLLAGLSFMYQGKIGGNITDQGFEIQAIKILRNEVISRADRALYEKPVTITSFVCTRSAGGIHDFYSEGDYWWPDPENPNGPYIQ